MTKDEKLAAAVEFAQRVLVDAMSDDIPKLRTDTICEWARELGLITVRKVTRLESHDFGVDPGTEVYDFENWMQPRVAA